MLVNNFKYITTVNANKEFAVIVKLTEGINKISAEVFFNGNRISKSAQVEYNYIIDHKPVANIETTVNSNSVTLNASSSYSPDSSALTFSWSADPQNPEIINLNGNNSSIRII